MSNKSEKKNSKEIDWKQRGPYIIKKNDETEMGIWIGNNKVLVGWDEDGKPILEDK
jgi:hypothetical protein